MGIGNNCEDDRTKKQCFDKLNKHVSTSSTTMKRVSNLYNKICSVENLQLADRKARRGKLDSYGVKRHNRNRKENIQQLHEALVNKTFCTSEYEMFTIYESKERLIYRLPYFPDRIVHHAIMNVMEPIWMKVFTADTYSCIKGRGIHAIVPRLKRDLRDRDGTKYCLKLDVKKFYPSIDHEVLKVIVRKKVKDNDLLWLLDEIIDSADGVPIGNYLSQYFANLYLAYFDHWIKEVKGVEYYYRYADDMVILSDDKVALHALLIDIKRYLKERLKLDVKSNWQVFPVDARGIDFVGYVFYHTHILLRKSIKQNMFKAIKKHKDEPDKLKKSLASYRGWMKHCNSVNLNKKVNNEIESRLQRTASH